MGSTTVPGNWGKEREVLGTFGPVKNSIESESTLMLRRKLMAGLMFILAAWTLSGCGGYSSKSTPVTPSGRGSLYTFIGDTPICDVLAFRVTVSGLSLTAAGGQSGATLVSSNDLIKVNFAALRDFSTVLNLASVTEGTYDQATITISTPQLVVFDPTKDPPTRIVIVTASTMAPKVSIQPALQVTKDKVSALRLDLDLVKSIEVDAQGQVTGNVTPTFVLTPIIASGDQGFGEMDDLFGFITNVTASNATAGFIGNFTIKTLSSSGPSVIVNLTPTTELFGASQLSQIPTGSFVEVDGFIGQDGNFVAKSVEIEHQENPDQNMLATIGLITRVTRDSNGNLTQFNLYVRGTEPGDLFGISDDSVAAVNVSSSTAFQFSARNANFANLTFDPAGLAVGQEVVVHGKFTKPPTATPPAVPGPTTIDADKVYLKLQTIQGNFASLVQAGSDDKTGAFQLAPCAAILRGTPVLVLTNNQTAYLNVNGLNELSSQPTLLVKGLPFLQAQGNKINGVSVPPGTLVVLAKQVHQL